MSQSFIKVFDIQLAFCIFVYHWTVSSGEFIIQFVSRNYYSECGKSKAQLVMVSGSKEIVNYILLMQFRMYPVYS